MALQQFKNVCVYVHARPRAPAAHPAGGVQKRASLVAGGLGPKQRARLKASDHQPPFVFMHAGQMILQSTNLYSV